MKKRSGIDCQIRFYETERCTELFFIYYFKYTTQKFQTSEDVEVLLNKICGYDKTLKFFRGHPLHQFFEMQGGNFVNAIANASRSLVDVRNVNRDCTYSEIGSMFNDLGIE